jgi:hypothetical protein
MSCGSHLLGMHVWVQLLLQQLEESSFKVEEPPLVITITIAVSIAFSIALLLAFSIPITVSITLAFTIPITVSI